MAFVWSDGFDCYATGADATTGYWDTTVASSLNLVAGRFAGSQAFSWNGTASQTLAKTSSVNDAVHHINVAFRQTFAISGSSLGLYLQLLDGATAQCSIVFRSDGAILLTAGAANGTVLATYTGAFPVVNTWYSFEIEVVISNTAGWMKVRKNGNTTEDFTSSLTLDTQASANAYANKLQIAQQIAVSTQNLDDLYWRSDASSVPWLGDMKCITRYPASDASVQFSRAPTTVVMTPYASFTTATVTAGNARYTPFTASRDGMIGAATVSLVAGYTGNLKCSIFASSGTAPTAVLGSAAVVVNPATGANTLTFSTPVAVVMGVQYWIGFVSDTTSGTWSIASAAAGMQSTTSYASFPFASPVATSTQATICSLIISPTNAALVAEAQQDGTATYVYDSVPGHADFYGINSIASTPLTTFAVTTRAYAIKSDAGTRTMAVQLKSGASTVASPTVVLTPSNWQWAWRHDTTDPATGAAWTAAAVNVCSIGPTVIA
jgi:hypothetical protein